MNARIVLVIVLASACLGVAVWAVLDEDQGGEPLDLGAGISRGGESGEGSDSIGGSESGGPASEENADARIQSVPFSEERGNVVSAGGLWIRTVDESSKALQGVVVDVITAPGLQNLLFPAAGSADQKILQQVRTNSQGEALIRPLPRTTFAMRARSGTLFGFLPMNPTSIKPDGDYMITLRPVRRVEVTVVNEGGDPVPHVLVVAKPDPGGSARSWTTAPDGTARFEVTCQAKRVYEKSKFVPEAQLLSGTVAGKATPWNEGGVTRARIVVPGSLTITVKVVNEKNDPASSKYGLRMKVLAGTDPNLARSLIDESRVRSFSGSEVSVAGFEPDTNYQLVLTESGRVPVVEKIQTPPGGTHHEVLMERGGLVPAVTVRVLDAEGSPLANHALRAQVNYPTAPSSGNQDPLQMFGMVKGDNWLTASKSNKEIMSDGDGRIQLAVRPHLAGKLEFHPASPLWFAQSGKEAIAKLTFGELAPGRVLDLGDIRAKGVQLLLAGRVLHMDGQPAPGAVVSLTVKARKGSFDMSLFQIVTITATSDAKGRFKIISGVRRTDLLAVARLGGAHQSQEQPFKPGDRDVTLRLASTGSLAGVLLPEAEGYDQTISVRLSAANGSRGGLTSVFSKGTRSAGTRKDGTFNINGLPAGSYTAEVTMSGISVLTVESIKIVSGGVTRDPRLDGVTVGGELEMGTVTVRDDDLNPVKKASVVVRIPKSGPGPLKGERRTRTQNTDKNGTARFLVPKGVLRDLTVSASGFAEMRLFGMSLPQEVRLDRGCRLTVELICTGPLPETKKFRGFTLELVPVEEEKPRPDEAIASVLDGHRRPPLTAAPVDPSSLRAVFERLGPRVCKAILRPTPVMNVKGSSDNALLAALLKQAIGGGKGGFSLGTVEVPAGVREKTIALKVDLPKLAEFLKK